MLDANISNFCFLDGCPAHFHLSKGQFFITVHFIITIWISPQLADALQLDMPAVEDMILGDERVSLIKQVRSHQASFIHLSSSCSST
jgi:hypothetical protein